MIREWYDWYRLGNFVIAMIAVIHLLRYARCCWRSLREPDKEQWVIWFVTAAACVVLSGYGLLEHLPFSVRPVIFSVISLSQLRGIYVKHLWDLKPADVR